MKVTFIKTGKRVKPKENIFNTYFNKNIDKNKKINKTPNETVKIKNDNKNNEHKRINKSEIGGAFKTIFKKNQIVILTLALILPICTCTSLDLDMFDMISPS